MTAPQPPALAEIRGRAEALTDARLAEIRERLEAATEGPWVPYDMGDDVFTSDNKAGWWWVWQQSKLPYYGGVLEVDQKFDDMPGAIGNASITDASDGHVEHTDAVFIAAARQDIPALLDEIDRLRAALKNRQAAIEARIDQLEQKPTSAYDEMTPAEAYHEALCDALEAMRGHL